MNPLQMFLTHPIKIADLADTLLSRFSRRAVPGCFIRCCPGCGAPLHIPPCCEVLLQKTEEHPYCLACARRLHPDRFGQVLIHCSSDRKLIKARQELN